MTIAWSFFIWWSPQSQPRVIKLSTGQSRNWKHTPIARCLLLNCDRSNEIQLMNTMKPTWHAFTRRSQIRTLWSREPDMKLSLTGDMHRDTTLWPRKMNKVLENPKKKYSRVKSISERNCKKEYVLRMTSFLVNIEWKQSLKRFIQLNTFYRSN